ncbi:MAG TPA: hypothetical protein VFK00_00195 [Rhodanobacteraceae bacterium]|jgi:general secretion pathway protein N|nr:hypothetical protein [Rhodanobacteraceae bacterium]
MNAADRRRLTPVIGILAVVLAALLVVLWMGLGSGVAWHDTTATAAAQPAVASTTPPPTVEPLDQYSVVWERPLFSPSRTPEAATAGDSGASGDLQLTGVIMLPGLKMAILHDKRTGKDYRAIAGQPSHGGPVLVELRPRSAVVESGGSRLQLHLVPGPSAETGNASPESGGSDGDDGMEPDESAGSGASVMVTRHGAKDSAGRQAAGAGPASNEARARALRARIEARRRQAQRDGGG